MKLRATADEALVNARRLQAFVDKLYRGKKPKNVADELIAEHRRRERPWNRSIGRCVRRRF